MAQTFRQPSCNPINVSLRAYIRRERRARFWTQARLAERAGYSRQYVNRIERGLYDPSLEMIDALLRAMDIEPALAFMRIGAGMVEKGEEAA